MASTTQSRRPGGEGAAAPASFSYAQAAKGLSSNSPAASASANRASGTATEAKDTGSSGTAPAPTQTTSPANWADDAEAAGSRDEKLSSQRESGVDTPPVSSKQAENQMSATASNASTHDSGALSTSATAKDDDASSLQNAPSESASNWENKSQASTSVEKSSEPAEKRPEKGKGKNAEKAPLKPLQEAPLPAVNPWTRRADELKAKAAQKATTPKVVTSATSPVTPNGTSQSHSSQTHKSAPPKEKKARDDEKPAGARREGKSEMDSDKSKKGLRSRNAEKDTRSAGTSLPLPPDRDQESWPTPENAVDEEKKKGQGKVEKNDTDRKETSSSRPTGKQEWVPVPYTPSVIFNTPLPNAASSRRGGRGGGRGGAQPGGRGGSFSANGVGNSEKEVSTQTAHVNGDMSKRGRSEALAGHDDAAKEDRSRSVGANTANESKSPALVGEKASKIPASAQVEDVRRSSSVNGSTSGSQLPGQNNPYPRQLQHNRPNKGRRGDFGSQTEKKRDGEGVSPTKDASTAHDRRTSTTAQADGTEEGERRATYPHDAQNGHSKPPNNERRQFGSFSGRDRVRGGGRTPRGGYQNGHHQFTNGHAPTLQGASSFPLRSPTTFHPDQGSFFPNAPPHSRQYRNGHRSQSVTTENVYGRPHGYPAGSQQMAPIQTFMPGMYDYSMMQHPMSAVPFSPSVVDQNTLFSLVTTQLEYYFSVENLCKDIFLRKHMDSKGFVFLTFIAGFNRIKHLTTDMELIKFVCYHSRAIDFRVGVDGKDRLRPREGWEKWVLGISERDPSAQNDGPDELHHPPIPHPNGFEHAGPHYVGVPAGSPTGPVPHPLAKGVHPAGPQDPSMVVPESMPNGQAINGVNGVAGSNGHLETHKDVSGESDSFLNEQVEALSVIVRKQEQPQVPTLPPSATRTFSNGSIDSRSDLPDESDEINGWQKINGTIPAQGFESRPQDGERRILSPFAPSSMRPFWVKGKDAPVNHLPPDSTYESYTHLRFKALEQRNNASHGSCPYDMDVLYQFWSHFLVRNFNLQMYQEFRHFALEDSARRGSDVGLTNLIKFYGESLLSTQSLIRKSVARHYVDLVKSETESHRPAFLQLQSAYRTGALDPHSRTLINGLLDPELKGSLE